VFVSDIRYGNLEHFDLNKPRTELIYAGKLEYPILKTRKTAEENIKFGEDLGGITDQGDLMAAIYMSYLTMVVQCGGLFL
jgi:ABC-type transport system involved in cytochrome c biogenesis ATPase subunit